MFLNFFNELREAKVPVTLKEYLALMEAMDKGVIDRDVEDFYYLARAALVKDERNIDKFDRVFAEVFKGLEAVAGKATDEIAQQDIPDEWLKKLAEKLQAVVSKTGERNMLKSQKRKTQNPNFSKTYFFDHFDFNFLLR